MTSFPPNQRDVTADGPPFRIDRQGQWWHGDRMVTRPELAQLFASILRRDDAGNYWMWHPGERCAVAVEDAPFIIDRVDFNEGQVIFTPRYHGPVVLGPDHALSMRDGAPYIDLGAGLSARCTTQVYYALVDHAARRDGQLWLDSAGVGFSLGYIDAA